MTAHISVGHERFDSPVHSDQEYRWLMRAPLIEWAFKCFPLYDMQSIGLEMVICMSYNFATYGYFYRDVLCFFCNTLIVFKDAVRHPSESSKGLRL